jgi:glycosyltransferase 2 family protein
MPHISPKTQRRLSLLVSVVSLAAVAWWISKQDTPQFPDSAEGWTYLLGAVGVYGVALTVRGFRWHRILRLIHIPHKRADAYRLVLVGYMGNNVLPVRGGEILRIGLLGSRTTARRREILSSVIAERVLDAAVLAALFALLTWFNVADAPAGQTPAAIAAIALVLAAIALAAYLALRRRGFFHAFHEKVGPFLRAMKLFAHVEGVLLAGLTVVAWCCEGLTLLLIGESLGLGLHLLDTLSIIVLASLFAAIPAAPGYAGTFDAGIVLGLKAVGVTGGAAVGFVLLARFAMFVPVTLVGLFLLLHTYGGFRRAQEGSEVFGDAGRLAVEDPPAEREGDDDDAGRDQQPVSSADGLPSGRRGRVDDRMAHLSE